MTNKLIKNTNSLKCYVYFIWSNFHSIKNNSTQCWNWYNDWYFPVLLQVVTKKIFWENNFVLYIKSFKIVQIFWYSDSLQRNLL